MDYILCFFGWYVAYRLRDGWTYRAKTWWNGREHTRECARKGFYFIFRIQDGRQLDYIVKKESFVFFGLSVFSIFSN